VLDELWRAAAARIGIAVDAGADARASFAAVCRSLVAGRTAPYDPAQWRDVASLRVQHELARRSGVGMALGPAEARGLDERGDRSVRAALSALGRVDAEPWGPVLAEALEATARAVGAAVAAHPSGLAPGEARAACGACAWRSWSRGRVVCQQAEGEIDDAWPACARFEAALDCQDCGACCREAFTSVEVKRDDPAVVKLPMLIEDRGSYLELRRDGGRCAALAGGGGERYACTVYDDRPQACRDFTAGTSACLLARRRVGTSE
jgi:hypothetical protein